MKSFLEQVVRWTVAVCVVITTVSCGGGGGEPSPLVASVTGKVVDGYIRGATVYWDCNNNTTLDAGEISTITTAGGSYAIAPAPSSTCDLLAYVPASAIDEDNPAGPIGYSYTMAAAPGNFAIISPLTTLVTGALKSGQATSVQAADTLVASQLGFGGSILFDYKAAPTLAISKTLSALANYTAKALSYYPVGNPLVQTTGPVLADLTVANSTPGISASMQMGLINFFTFKSDPIARSYQELGQQPNANYIVLRNKYDAANNTLLDTMAAALTQAQAGEYGVVDFWKLAPSQMEPWVTQFDRTNIGADKLSKISALQTARAKGFADASIAWNTTISDEIGFQNYLMNNPAKTADFALEIGSNTINIVIDVASIISAGAPAALRDTLIPIKATNKRLEFIQNMKGYLADSGTCLTKTESIFMEIEKNNPSSPLISQQIPGVFVACKDWLGDILKDAKTIRFLAKNSADIAALKASGKLLVVEKDLYATQNGKTTDSIVVANLKILKQLTEAYKDILAVVKVPGPLATASAGVDLVIQYLDAYITGAEIGDAVIASNSLISASATQRYNKEARNLYQTYYASWLTLFSDYFRVIDASVDPYVKNISVVGGSMTTGSPATVTVTGQNLPLTAVMSLAGGSCQTPTNQSAGGFTVVCTPGTAAGSQVATISTAASGVTVIDASKTVTVSAAPVTQPPSSGTGLLNDTGVTANQCYQAGSDVLVSCTSAAAIALNTQQDGMVGRDVTTPNATDGKLGFSYTKLDATGSPLPATATSWSCTLDNFTGLMWQMKTSDGSVLDKTRLFTNIGDGRANDVSSFAAAVNAINLCGYSDWRVSTINELLSIQNFGISAIDPDYFESSYTVYWTGTPYVSSLTNAWTIGTYSNGYGLLSPIGRSLSVRAVRGGSSSVPQSNINRYSMSLDGILVTDSVTGLTWKRCTEGQVWDGITCAGTATPLTLEQAFVLANGQVGWRIPNIKELNSISDFTRISPSINTTAFPNTYLQSGYLSSTPLASNPSYSWFIEFSNGGSGHNPRTNSGYVRLVK